jgi:hypothetical protein
MKTRDLTQVASSLAAFAFLGVAVASVSAGCSSTPSGAGDDGGPDGGCNPAYTICSSSGGGDGGGVTTNLTSGSGDGGGTVCAAGTGKACIQSCAGGGDTTISGHVFDPAGKNPLYDVSVYVPTYAPDPLPQGSTCDTCSSLYTGKPIAAALTDASGHFTITGAPSTTNVPLVVQVGKWRKMYTVPNVAHCTDTNVDSLHLRLPKNHTEGDIPNIAVSTGAADSLECLLRRIGIDAGEYGAGANGNPNGRIHIFTGGPNGQNGATTNPPAPTSFTALWQTSAQLSKFDIVILSCEAQDTTNMNQQALLDYAQAGGRVFASHFHYAWFNTGPFAALAPPLATWTTGIQSYVPDAINTQVVTTLPNGMLFPKGQAMKAWLGNVGALQNGALPITQAKHNALVGAANMESQAWIVSDSTVNPPNQTEYFSFNTPYGVPPAEQCGRVVYSDLHVSGGWASNGVGVDYPSGMAIVPDGCGTGNLTAQEKALEFMLFDLSACITPNMGNPMPIMIQ